MGPLSLLLPAGTMGAAVILVAMTVSSGRNNNNQKGEFPSDLGHLSSFEGLGSFFLSTRSLEDPGSRPLLTKSSKIKEDFVEKKQEAESFEDFAFSSSWLLVLLIFLSKSVFIILVCRSLSALSEAVCFFRTTRNKRCGKRSWKQHQCML